MLTASAITLVLLVLGLAVQFALIRLLRAEVQTLHWIISRLHATRAATGGVVQFDACDQP